MKYYERQFLKLSLIIQANEANFYLYQKLQNYKNKTQELKRYQMNT